MSIYLFEDRLGLGWGRALLARGEAFVMAQWPQLDCSSPPVMPGNQPSLKVFREAGFLQSACAFTRVLKDHRQ